jgi:predicted nucleic acid-binding protein
LRVYVVDASVAARFLLVEELSDKADWLLQRFHDDAVELKAPGLVKYEVGNALWKAIKQKVIDAHEASRKFSQFIRLKLDCIELDEQESLAALTWAMKNDATYYDSVYVKASEKTGAILLTADDAFYERASKEVPTVHLRDLKDR